jgi:hypothetical protein
MSDGLHKEMLMFALRQHRILGTFAFLIKSRKQAAIPRRLSVANFPTKIDVAGGALKVWRTTALTALLVTLMSLTSCAGMGDNSFLGPAYDGPTAAYGYNIP